MHKLKGIYGIAYSCSQKDNKYCDDWFTNNYKNIYNSTNNRSLCHVRSLGFNNIRTYYLDPEKNHTDFLFACDNYNLSVEIGISNNLLDTRNIEQIKKLITPLKQHNCIKIYTVGNEYSGLLDNIIFAIELIYTLDNNKYIMHSSIFDNQFDTARRIYKRIPEYIKPKYIVGINIYFYNNLGKEHGNILQNVINNYYNDNILKNTYLIVSEYGNNNDDYDAIWNFSYGNIECLKKYPKYLGYELFSYSNENWKGIKNNENNYGIITENGYIKQSYNAILNFKNTDEFKKYIKEIL